MYLTSVLPGFWHNCDRVENWILRKDVPMAVSWNVKNIADQINWILIAFAAYYYGKTPNKVNRTSIIVFILWCCIDAFLYIYNYKSFGYFATYFWLPLAWFLIYFWNSKQAEKSWKILHKK